MLATNCGISSMTYPFKNVWGAQVKYSTDDLLETTFIKRDSAAKIALSGIFESVI